MNPIVVVGVLAALVAAGAMFVLVRPVLGDRMPWAALAVAIGAAALTIAIGRLTGAASLDFLIGVTAFTLPVLVLLEAAAVASGADRLARWLILVVWGLVVFPAVAIIPLLATRGCLAPECGFEDFGGALPLVVSSSAFLLLAWLPAGVHERAEPRRPSSRRVIAAVALLWLAVVAWLVHLEGTIDAYTPRIALAAVVAPVTSALGWLVVDRLRNVARPVKRSLLLGLAVGMVVAIPGAVSVGMPWSPIVGLLAGAAAALVFALSERDVAGLAARWGMTVLVAIAVAFVAPAVSGDDVGVLFSARAAVLTAPVLVLVAVSMLSVVVSAPVWVLVRRHAAGERIPTQILQSDGMIDE
jgi:ammonium transporter, Amt family